MLNCATLSGWGQPHNALAVIAPEAAHIDYARHSSPQAALLDIGHQAWGKEAIIGWSLGGQLAVRAIIAGLLRPKKLVLIATPFQFVATPTRKLGMPADLYEKFRGNYLSNPSRAMHMAWESVLRGDNKPAQLRSHMDGQDKKKLMEKNWLHWLDILQGFSCFNLYMADFPPTLLIHGDKDAVVYPQQSQEFARAIPHAKMLRLQDCGHAPHWHDTQRVKQAVREFIDV